MDEFEGGAQGSDPADRLHRLCLAMITAMEEHKFGTKPAGVEPLWKTLDAVPERVGAEDYAVLRDNFLMLCLRIEEDMNGVALRRPGVRNHWKSTLTNMKSIFDARRAAQETSKAFDTCLSRQNMAVLETISERLQSTGLLETPRTDLDAAFAAMRDAIAEFERSDRAAPHVIGVLRHLLSQMEAALSVFEIFGEGRFWAVYKETVTTFMQLHSEISASSNSSAMTEKLRRVFGHLKTGLSVAANTASIAGGVALLFSP